MCCVLVLCFGLVFGVVCCGVLLWRCWFVLFGVVWFGDVWCNCFGFQLVFFNGVMCFVVGGFAGSRLFCLMCFGVGVVRSGL